MGRIETSIDHLAENPAERQVGTNAAACAAGFGLLTLASTLFTRLEDTGASPCFLLAGAATGILLALAALRRRPGASARALIAVCALAFAAGFSARVVCGFGASAPAWALGLADVLVGLGDTAALVLWGRALARFEPQRALAAIAGGYTCALTLGVALVALLPAPAVAGFSLAAMVGCVVLLALVEAQRPAPSEPVPSAETDAATPCWQSNADAAPWGRDALAFLWKPVLGALLCAFITGCSAAAGAGPLVASSVPAVAGTVLAGTIVGVAAGTMRPFPLRTFYQTVLPIAALVILCVPFLADAGLPGSSVPISFLNGCGFTLIDIAVFSSLATAAHIVDAPSDAVFGLERAAAAGAMVAGGLLQPVLSAAALKTACAVAAACYLGAIVVSLARAKPGAPVPARPTVERLCAELADRAALSPREAQVLPYLARGRGSTYIAQELCISVQTVKTHTKHIYEKLGVHSREELLDLFLGEA